MHIEEAEEKPLNPFLKLGLPDSEAELLYRPPIIIFRGDFLGS